MNLPTRELDLPFRAKPTEESLRTDIQAIDLLERLEVCLNIIGELCSKGRPPSMTIPCQSYDEDVFMSQTINDAKVRIAETRK